MTFEEAFLEMIAGKPICSTEFHDKNARWLLENGKLIERKESFADIELTFHTFKFAHTGFGRFSWKIYVAPLLFKDLKPGQKFKYKAEGNNGIIKLRLDNRKGENLYARLESGMVLPCPCPNTDEVILVND